MTDALDKLRTLVLTPAYTPQRVVAWQEAVCLLVTEKVEVVESYPATISSPSITLQVPAVVRHTKGFHIPRRAQRFSRRGVLVRDRYRCQYCGCQGTSATLNYDHVIPRKLGGRTVWENIVTCCYPCNSRKGGRTPAQAGMALLSMPTRPTVYAHLFVLEGSEHMQSLWEPYLGR